MTSADGFIAAARKEIGTTESPAGSNHQPYAAIAGHANGQPWCATFIVAIARRVGLHLPSESAYTPAMADGFRRAGRFGGEPRRGDIAFYDFPDSKNRIQHVGVVTGWTESTVTTVEGNTASGSRGSQDNGGTVAERTRPRSHVVGYGHPIFTDQAPDKPKEVRVPDHNPPIHIDVVSSCPHPDAGVVAAVLLDPSGATFTFPTTAPAPRGVNGMAYWGDRKAAHIELTGERDHPIAIWATTGEGPYRPHRLTGLP